ncbi:MAG TPA: branched-chain amino acid ABC transporter permease [Trueperaceae bacterium]
MISEKRTSSQGRTAPRDRTTWHLVALLLLLVAVALVVPRVSGAAIVIAINVLLYAGWATSWDLLGGWTGQVSLGHAAFVGLGAYTVALFAQRLDLGLWVSVPIGALFCALLALGWGAMTFRLRGSYFVLSTIAVAEILRLVAINETWLTGGAQGIFIFSIPRLLGLDVFERSTQLFMALFFFALVLCVTLFVSRGRLGYRMRAVREDEEAAQAAGINPQRVKLTAFALSGALTGLGGAFYAVYLSFLEPHDIFFLPLSVQIALTAIIGGRGTIWGPFAGALLLVLSREMFRGVFDQANLLIYGVLILVVVLFAPRGMLGELARAAVRRRYAGDSRG